MNRWFPPAERRIIRSLIEDNIAVEPWNLDNTPTLYTDAIHRRPIGSSGAEGTTLGAVLYDLNQGVGWTDGIFYQSVGSSDDEAEVLARLCWI
jgi:hypothetical protein